MIIVKDIPDIIKINLSESVSCLVLPSGEKDEVAAGAVLKEIKNIPTSGVVIKKIDPYCSRGTVQIYDPRGFSCNITNFDELIEHVDISHGVIEQELWYGIRNTRGGSWMLLTEDMKNKTVKALRSVKDLRPGFVYDVFGDSVVYLGRLDWKDEYGTFRPHQTFVNTKTREISAWISAKASNFRDLGYDSPDVYEEAKSILENSYQCSPHINVSEISLPDSTKYTTFEKSMLVPKCFKELKMYGSDRRTVIFAKQVDKENIKFVMFISDAYREKKYRDSYEYNGYFSERVTKSIDTTTLKISIYNMDVTVSSGMVKLSFNPEHFHDVKFDLSNVAYLNNILKDTGYKCIDSSDRDTWERFRKIGCGRWSFDRAIYCKLTNGEIKNYLDIIRNVIKF